MKHSAAILLSILAGIVLIVLAYQLDLWSYHLRPSFFERELVVGEDLAWMLPAYFADALLAGLLLAWTWFAHLKVVPKTRWVALLYILLGVAMPVYSMVMIETGTYLNSPEFVILYSVPPFSFASFTGLWIAVFGLQRLIFGGSAI